MNINRLLLIQDNTLVQNFYRDRLERAGFIVQSVATVEEGLRRMGSALPNVVVLDPLLPEGDAAQSIASVRSLMGASDVPVVVLPTQQRCITEAIEQNKRTRLIEPGGNVAATLITEAAGLAHFKMADLAEMTANSEPDERWRTAALNAAPAAVAAMRQTLHSLVCEPQSPEHLRTLLQNAHCFADQMSLLGPSGLSQTASALEVLAYGLVQFPERLDQLTLRTLGQAVDFLGALLETKHATRSADLKSAHVMIVEDEANARELIIMAMSLVGLDADGLDSPAASLAVLSTQPCDLIFLDINLPEMDGFELCTKLRAMSLHELTPIVFLTGMNSFKNRVQSNLSGGNDFVGKPFNVAELGLKALIWVLKGQFGMI
jgi:DNA-binding response OmpR family regulator